MIAAITSFAAGAGRAAPPPRDEIRDVAEQVFDRPEFVREKGLVQRILDWFADLFPERSVSSGGFSAASNLLLYVALALLAVLLVVLIVKIVRNRVRRAGHDDDGPTVSIGVRRATADWSAEARRLEAEGRWKDALLARYRELVGSLVDADVLSGEPGRTTGELRAEMAVARPEAAGWFDEATTLFELPWYADAPTGAGENRRFKELAAQVSAATPRTDDREQVPA